MRASMRASIFKTPSPLNASRKLANLQREVIPGQNVVEVPEDSAPSSKDDNMNNSLRMASTLGIGKAFSRLVGGETKKGFKNKSSLNSPGVRESFREGSIVENITNMMRRGGSETGMASDRAKASLLLQVRQSDEILSTKYEQFR